MGKMITLQKSKKEGVTYKNACGVHKTLGNEGFVDVKGFSTRCMTLEALDEDCDENFMFYPDDRVHNAPDEESLPIKCQSPENVFEYLEKIRIKLRQVIDEEEMEAIDQNDQFMSGDWQDYVTAAGVPLKKYLKQAEQKNYQKWLAKMEKASRVMDDVVDINPDSIPGNFEPIRPRGNCYLRKDRGQKTQYRELPRLIAVYDEENNLLHRIKTSGHSSRQPRYKKPWRKGGYDHRSKPQPVSRNC